MNIIKIISKAFTPFRGVKTTCPKTSSKIVFFIGWGDPRAVQEKVKQHLVNFDPNFAPDAPAPSLSIAKSETSLPGKALSFKREVLSSVWRKEGNGFRELVKSLSNEFRLEACRALWDSVELERFAVVELLPNGDLASFHPQQCVETAAEQEALARTFKAILAKLPEKEFSEAAVFVLNSAKSINKADPRFLRKDFIVSIKPLSGKDPVTLGVEVYQPWKGYLKSIDTLVKAIKAKIRRWGDVDADYSEAVARRAALPEYFVEDPILNKALQGALEDISEGKYTRCVAVDMPHEAAEEIRRYSDFLNKIETGDCMVVVSSGHDTVAEAADSMWQVGSEVIERLDPVNPGFLRFCDSLGLTEGQVEELLAQERVQEAIQAKAKLLEQLGEHSRLKKLGVPEVLGSEEDK